MRARNKKRVIKTKRNKRIKFGELHVRCSSQTVDVKWFTM